MNQQIQLFLLFLPLIAFLYSAVGHGGASGYLALMAILNFAPDTMKPLALILNMSVSLVAFIAFYSKQAFSWPLFLTLIGASIPSAFLGGRFQIDPQVYRIALGVLLVIPALRLAYQYKKPAYPIQAFSTSPALLIGGSIGFLSGLLGIGGGILLSPVLFLLRWSSLREIAGMSALFIFVNSLAGLLGQYSALGKFFQTDQPLPIAWMMLLALAGGLGGSYIGSRKLNTPRMKLALSVVLLLASYKLIVS